MRIHLQSHAGHFPCIKLHALIIKFGIKVIKVEKHQRDKQIKKNNQSLHSSLW